MADEWREWRLAWYADDLCKRRPADKPPRQAELSADGAWASAFVERGGVRLVAAMWMRYRMPTRETLRRETERRPETRLDADRTSG